MASNNPGNFANRPTEEVREIAAKGGHASHGGGNTGDSHTTSGSGGQPGRNPDGTFTKGSQVASELGSIGGHHSHGVQGGSLESPDGAYHPGRNPDGTFTKGSQEASELGHIGGSK